MSVNEKMTAIADSIRDKTGGTESLTLDAMATEIPKVYEKGKKAEREEFWEEYYTSASWAYAFYGAFWSDKNYNPHKTIKPTTGTSASSMYYGCTITDTRVPLDLSDVTNISYIFYNAKFLKTIRDITFLKSGSATNAFSGCSALENITVSGSTQISLVFTSCTLLNKASIESIINALSKTTSGLTVTFSKEAVNNAFGIDIDDESTYTEEWNTLRNTKANWTFAYN